VISEPEIIIPNWQVPDNVQAMVTLRTGGVSQGRFRAFNLATHVGDNPEHVRQNRQRLNQQYKLPSEPCWLEQTHSTTVVDLTHHEYQQPVSGDAAFTRSSQQVCVVLTADCLPVFLYEPVENVVAVIHAGWRELANGIIENTVTKMTSTPQKIQAWLGPAIGPEKFEVGEEVRDIFCDCDPQVTDCFVQTTCKNDKRHYLTDIYKLAERRLNNIGIISISGGDYCTMSDAKRFYSYRRDGETGRMASLIWLSGN